MSCVPRLWTGYPPARDCQLTFANSLCKVYSPHPTKVVSLFGHNLFCGYFIKWWFNSKTEKHISRYVHKIYIFILFLDICLIRALSDFVHPEIHPENAASSNRKVGFGIRSLRVSLSNRLPGALAKTDPVSALGRIPHSPLSAVGSLPSMKRLVGRNRPFLFALFFRSHSSSKSNEFRSSSKPQFQFRLRFFLNSFFFWKLPGKRSK